MKAIATTMITTTMTVFLLLGMLAACNTVEGAGEDVKAAGHGLEHSAAKHKNY